MADRALELSKKRNVKNFEVAFEIAIKAFNGEGLSQKKFLKDVASAEEIMMSSFEIFLIWMAQTRLTMKLLDAIEWQAIN